MINSDTGNRALSASTNAGLLVFSRRGKLITNRTRPTVDALWYASRVPKPVYTLTRGVFAYKDDLSKILFFQFNPTDIRDIKTANYSERAKPGQDFVDPIWIQGGKRQVSFELFLDATQDSNTNYLNKPGQGLRAGLNPTDEDLASRIGNTSTHTPSRGTLDQVEFIQSLQRPNTGRSIEAMFSYNGHVPTSKFFAPPEFIFSYGPLYLECVMESLSISHELFNDKLVPVRSRATISLWVIESRKIQVVSESLGTISQQTRSTDFEAGGGTSVRGISSPITTGRPIRF